MIFLGAIFIIIYLMGLVFIILGFVEKSKLAKWILISLGVFILGFPIVLSLLD